MDGVLGQNVACKWVWIPLEDCFCHLRCNTNRVGNFSVEKSSSYNSKSVDGSGGIARVVSGNYWGVTGS